MKCNVWFVCPIYNIRCKLYTSLISVNSSSFYIKFSKKVAEKFGGFPESVYLCTRFAQKRSGLKEFFEEIT